MPRDGSGNYLLPFPEVEEDTTIESGVYNGFTVDIATDLNAPRPIMAGGTGAPNVRDARTNLGVEAAQILVTNYDSHIWAPGSFYSSAVTGQAAPVDGHAFAGIVYMTDANNMVIEARDQNDTLVPGRVYVAEKKAGAFGTPKWTVASNDKLDTTGGTMTGGLGISTETPYLILNRTSATLGQGAYVGGSLLTKPRWQMFLGDNALETATDLEGSNFTLSRFNNAGTLVDKVIEVARLDGVVKLNGHPKVNRDGDTMTAPLNTVAPTLPDHAANKLYVDSAPRVLNAQTGVAYTLTTADSGKLIWMANAAAFTLTIPAFSTVPIPIGAQIDLAQGGAGQVSVASIAGVTINSEDGRKKLNRQYATGTLVHITQDNWLLTGSLTA